MVIFSCAFSIFLNIIIEYHCVCPTFTGFCLETNFISHHLAICQPAKCLVSAETKPESESGQAAFDATPIVSVHCSSKNVVGSYVRSQERNSKNVAGSYVRK